MVFQNFLVNRFIFERAFRHVFLFLNIYKRFVVGYNANMLKNAKKIDICGITSNYSGSIFCSYLQF